MLHQGTQTYSAFLSIWHGTIAETSKEPRANFKAVETDNGTKYVCFYDGGVSGFITSVKWFDREIAGGKRIMGWDLEITDQGEKYKLSLPLGAAASVFMNCASNIDFNQQVHFSAWKDKDGKTAFLMRQPDKTGEIVRRAHTKDNPNGMPPPETTRKGTLDWTKSEDFLIDKIHSIVVPRIAEANAKREPMEDSNYSEMVNDFGDENAHGSTYGDHVQRDDAVETIPF